MRGIKVEAKAGKFREQPAPDGGVGGDGDAVLGRQGPDSRSLLLTKCADINVANAGIAAIRLAGGPAHHLDTPVAELVGSSEDFLQRLIGQDGANKPELHERTSFAS